MRKKFVSVILASSLVCVNVAPVYATTMQLVYDGKAHNYSGPIITLYVNNQKIETKVMSPVQINGRVLVPAREVFEAMGAKVDWNAEEKRVIINYKNNNITLKVNDIKVSLNGEIVELDVPAKIINDKIMIPLRFVSEKLGFDVVWNNEAKSVWISEKKVDEPADNVTPSTGQVYNGKPNVHSINLPSETHSETQVTGVSTTESNGVTTVSIKANGPLSQANVSFLMGKVVIDVDNSKSKLASSITPDSNSYITRIRTSQFTTDTTRIVLDLKSGALVDASFTADRKEITLKLSKQNMEQIKVTQGSSSDEIYFKGIAYAQAQVMLSLDGKEIHFILPNTTLNQSFQWKDLKSNYITSMSAKNVGNNVEGTVILNTPVDYTVKNSETGTTLVIAPNKESEIPPTEPIEPPKPVEPSNPEVPPTEDAEEGLEDGLEDGLSYVLKGNPTLYLSNIKGLSKNKISVMDYYRDKKIVLDLGDDYSKELKNQTLNINDSKIESIVVSTDTTTKLIVHTKTVYTYNMYDSNDQVKIELVKPREKYEKIVILDPGHGGTDSGAVANGLTEKGINFNQAMALYKLLQDDPNIKVYITRETDIYPTLSNRTSLANDIDGHLFISVHNNSSSATTTKGTETLYYPSSTDPRSKQIAQLVQNNIIKNCNMVNRGIKPRADLHVLRKTTMPAVLIETGFITNASEATLINSPVFINQWAQAVYSAVIESFDTIY